MCKTSILICCLCAIFNGLISVAQSNKSHNSSFKYPAPQGEYQVGTRFMVLTDRNRPDILTEKINDFRQISIQIWYPAEPNPGLGPIPYNDEEIAKHFIEMGLFKESFMNDVANATSYSYFEAPIVKKRNAFPIIIYSSSGVMNANIFLFENLASHGYVVLSVGHPHWCVFYYKSNGEVFFPNYENDIHYQNMWEEENSEDVNLLKEKITLAKSINDKKELLNKLNELMPVEISDVRLWVQDFDFILSELKNSNILDARFKGMMNFDNIGIMGYSKGGVAAAHACLSKNRFKAGINLSGFLFGDIQNNDIKVPFMNIESEESWCLDCEPINDLIYSNSMDDIYMVQIKGATHGNFTDLSAFKYYIADDFESLLGSIDGSLFLQIQSDYILSFFDLYLKGMESDILHRHIDMYDEIRFKSSIKVENIN